MTVSNKPYKVWWWAKNNNYGDILTPLLFDYYKIPYQFTPNAKQADIISTGSIASKAQSYTTVLGSGFISSKDKVETRAKYKFVRGPKTREKIINAGGICPEIYGDPALLLPELIDENKKTHEIGIIPHYVDYNLIKEKYPNEYVINLLTNDPIKTTKEITSCKKVITSSLHGLIVANAYGIPAAWVKFSNNLAGDDFKFYDYALSAGIKNFDYSTIDTPVFYTGLLNTKHIIEEFKNL
jgi:pyruvyltransferase